MTVVEVVGFSLWNHFSRASFPSLPGSVYKSGRKIVGTGICSSICNVEDRTPFFTGCVKKKTLKRGSGVVFPRRYLKGDANAAFSQETQCNLDFDVMLLEHLILCDLSGRMRICMQARN